ncbi:AbrB family transcriptional regulator [Candidatus Pacearchaeota archaeon CG10_big_fil_rev_8_21_14_0_10_31_24]|nr:MAG: AbrB family transcriptional regulator [Candidatus Pacearchaeota archaeon CG10_big_fil_rev_8_21_14_0_10_31_24]
MEMEITRMSSKGQVVIPSNFRKHIKEGDTLIVLKNNDQIILKLASAMDKQLAEDIEFAKRTEESWKEIEKGRGVRMSVNDFLKEMKSW